jgi:hypothetical protein
MKKKSLLFGILGAAGILLPGNAAAQNSPVAITQGYYFFDGTNSSRSAQYIGFAAIIKDNGS